MSYDQAQFFFVLGWLFGLALCISAVLAFGLVLLRRHFLAATRRSFKMMLGLTM
jgi:hypothetical protein